MFERVKEGLVLAFYHLAIEEAQSTECFLWIYVFSRLLLG